MRCFGVVFVVAACGAKAPAGVSNAEVTVEDNPSTERLMYAKRPRVDLTWLMPDFHDELRWPLTGMNHPSLDPRFAIADQLAVGLDWQQLCARGVHKRVVAGQKELRSYLHAWCDVQNRDVDAACGRLVPLLGSTTSGLGFAVRQDLANILVDHGNADKAEHWLAKHNIRDAQTLDFLAADYVEVGSLADAFTINRRALDNDARATDETKCRRLTRRIVIGLEIETLGAIDALKELAIKPEKPDPTCMQLYHKVRCWRDPAASCSFYFADQNVDAHTMLLVDSYYEWPAEKTGWFEWMTYADKARLALPTPGAADLVVTALETALAAKGKCPDYLLLNIKNSAELIRQAPDAPELEPRLQKLEHDCTSKREAPL